MTGTLQPTPAERSPSAPEVASAIRYAVDATGRVLEADDALRSLLRADVPWPMVGRIAGEMAPDENVRDLYRGLLARVHEGETVSFVQRHWEAAGQPRCVVEVSPRADGGVQFELTPLPWGRADDSDEAVAASAELLKLCAWCLDVDVGRWLSAEHAVNRYGLLDLPAPRPVTHGICPECREHVDAEDD